jgi:hypothetical protein
MPLIPKNFAKKLGSKKSDISKMEFVKTEATKEDVIEYFSIVRDMLPNERAFKVWMMDIMRLGVTKKGSGGKPICPVAFFTKRLRDIADWESAANKYGVLPFEGSYLDQPLYVIQGFNVIRAADSLYNSKKMKEMDKQNKKSTNSNRGRRRR